MITTEENEGSARRLSGDIKQGEVRGSDITAAGAYCRVGGVDNVVSKPSMSTTNWKGGQFRGKGRTAVRGKQQEAETPCREMKRADTQIYLEALSNRYRSLLAPGPVYRVPQCFFF